MLPGNVYSEILFQNINNASSIIKCAKCKSTNVEIVQRQIRSSDEPAHIFTTCKECKHVEVTND